MPLALLAIASSVDANQYQVIIIDGRLEEEPFLAIAPHLSDAICFGVTVITGAPIKDALTVSEQVKDANPSLPVIWGGWHTSLFPVEPLQDHAFIDITVQGQGEESFAEIVSTLDSNGDMNSVQGIAYRKNGLVIKNQKRHLVDMDLLPKVNYDLIDVEQYFRKKRTRQFDYITSIGCFYRCAFCADPHVYARKFSSFSPERMVSELVEYQRRFRFTDVNFQDETFFTYPQRIEAMAQGLIDRGQPFTWAATMRADQGARLTDQQWSLLKKSGLRRLLIGVESGSQEMMDWMQKDIKLSQVLHCAEKCDALKISVIFPFIVGFPNESDQSVRETIDLIKKLRMQNRQFETPIFYYKPYPGSLITKQVVEDGYQLPKSTAEWGEFDYIGSSGPWVSAAKEAFFEAFKFYLKLGYGKYQSKLAYPLRKLGQWRCKNEWFKWPIEKYLIERMRPTQKLS